jgi:hypothetical protein
MVQNNSEDKQQNKREGIAANLQLLADLKNIPPITTAEARNQAKDKIRKFNDLRDLNTITTA